VKESRIVKAIRSRRPYDYEIMVVTEKDFVEKVKKASKRILI